MLEHPSQIKTFDNLRTLLRNNKREDGVDLYQHLVEVVNHIIMNCPDDGLDKFEEISYLLKNKDSMYMSDYLKIEEEKRHAKFNGNTPSQMIKNINAAKAFFQVNKLITDNLNILETNS